MARKELMLPPNGVFSMNETSVGRNGNNRKRTDIQLIQFFLKQFYQKHPELFALLPKTKKRHSILVIDGEVGKQTEAGILVFQKHAQSIGTNIKTDGLVSVATGVKAASKSVFTIINLNQFFKSQGEGKEHHGNLQNHPEVFAFAPELAGELFTALPQDEFKG